MAAHTREEEIEMMKGEGSSWPIGFYLPLVKRDGSHTCGFLVAGEGPTVVLKNLHDDTPNPEVTMYDSFDAIVDDGWVVD